jgi:hypothetical protein
MTITSVVRFTIKADVIKSRPGPKTGRLSCDFWCGRRITREAPQQHLRSYQWRSILETEATTKDVTPCCRIATEVRQLGRRLTNDLPLNLML